MQLLGEATDAIEYLESSKGRVKDRDGKSLADWKGIVDDLVGEESKP